MEMNTRDDKADLRRLYPYLNDEQLQEAEGNLDRYVRVVLRICDRTGRRDNTSRHIARLTNKETDPTIRIGRSNPT